MRKLLKWLGILLGGLLGLALVALASVYVLSERALNQRFEVPNRAVAVPSDAASIERGEHLTNVIFSCSGCHEPNLAGGVLFEDPLSGRLAPSNLTSGQGGVAPAYSDQDWVRAIRHGVLPGGRPGIAMSSNLFAHITDRDLGAMIAYIKSVPPVDNEVPPTVLGPMGRVYVLLEPELLPASVVDHDAPRPVDLAPTVSVEYGAYLARICTMCHGENYAGWEGRDGAANLTPAGRLPGWTEADFLRTLRTGLTPEGKQLDPEMMPWDILGQMTDDELRAVWLFLNSLPPAEPNTQ
jgi:mono/diheme cytochrome c family protein